jgi:lipopolysaccharide export system permease protein
MYRTIAYVPGGQPIGALERVADKAVKTVVRWIKLGRKSISNGEGAAQ